MKKSGILTLLFLCLAVFAGGNMELKWELRSPKGTAYRKGETVFVTPPDRGAKAAISASQVLSRHTLEPGKMYRFSCIINSTVDQPREIVISYRGVKVPNHLGLYQVFRLKKGDNPIAVTITPVRMPRTGDSGCISIQLGLQKGTVAVSNAKLTGLDLSNRQKLPLSDNWMISPGRDKHLVKIPSTLDPKGMVIDFSRYYPKFVHRRSTVWIENKFNMPEAGDVLIGCAADWYFRAFLNGKLIYSTWERGNLHEKRSINDHVFILPCRKGMNSLRIEVAAGSKGWKFFWGTPVPPPEPVRFNEKNGYKPVDMGQYAIVPGSALDLSGIIPAPAGKSGRVDISADGRLACGGEKSGFRLYGYSSSIPAFYWGRSVSDDHFAQYAAELARATRAQGYNCFRLHGFDEWIMTETENPLKPGRFRDRWDRLVAEMKKEGIYVQLVIFSFGLYEPQTSYQDVYKRRNMHKARMFLGCEWERERFKAAVKMLMEHVNPYTGLAWKDDPAVASVEFYNEQTMAIRTFTSQRHNYPEDYKLIVETWSRFLKERYKNVPEQKRPVQIRGGKIDNPPIPGMDHSQLANDYAEFWYETICANNRWCENVLRENGYKGIVDNVIEPNLNVLAANWATVPVADGHTYLGFPSNWDRPGSRLSVMTSPVAADASFFRRINSSRMAGRPFFCGEYNQSFWNPYQYELPLGFIAYAAFADWSAMTIHDEAVLIAPPPNPACHIFSVGVNPVLRCGQFLGALLFLRGDVAPAKHQIRWKIPAAWLWKDGNSNFTFSDMQSRLGLITGTGIFFDGIKPYSPLPPGKNDLTLTVDAVGRSAVHEWHTTIVKDDKGGKELEKNIEKLRKENIISKSNPTDLAKGIFQTDTGEITLFSRRKEIRLITPKTEAVTLEGGNSAVLKHLAVSSSVNALVSASAMDEKTLDRSGKIVLVYATRAVNTGMTLEPDHETMRLWGGAPVLVQTGKLTVSLEAVKPLQAWALRMDGSRSEKLPVKYENGKLILNIDTAGLKNGPALFFELNQQ